VALLVAGGAAEVLPVSLNCPLPLRRTHPPTLVCCFCVVAAMGVTSTKSGRRATNPRQHRPKDLSKPRRDIHLVEIKYCEDTGPQNQLNAAKEQHKDLCNILQGASVTLHIILLGVGGTIYNTHTLKPFKELGLDSQRVKKLASKLHVHSVNFAAKLVHTRRALSSTIINSHQEPVSGQACNPLDPH